MKRFLGIGAVVLGVAGGGGSGAAIGLGWGAEARTVGRTSRIAERLDHGLSEVAARLERVEGRLAAIRGDLGGMRGEAETLAAANPELPRVQAAVERLLDRLLPT